MRGCYLKKDVFFECDVLWYNYTTHNLVTVSGINTIQLQHLHLMTPEPSRTDLVFYVIVSSFQLSNTVMYL